MLHATSVVTRPEHELLRRYVDYLGDDRVLLANYEAEPTIVHRWFVHGSSTASGTKNE